MLEDKLISKRYFDDDGTFVVFLIALPLFVISLLFTLGLIVRIVKEIKVVYGSYK